MIIKEVPIGACLRIYHKQEVKLLYIKKRSNYDVRGPERERSLQEDTRKEYNNPWFKINPTLTKRDEGTLDYEKIHSISKTL